MQRRDFLSPRHLVRATGEAVGALTEAISPPGRQDYPDVALLRFARRAMATQFEVILPYGTPHALTLAGAALDEVSRLEEQLTVYHESSEVSRLNRLGAQAPVAVEERLFGLLSLSARITQETQGAFDITTGALIKAWGFYRRRGRVPEAEERTAVMERVGMQNVTLDADRRSVEYQRPGLEINLGSIGKGYALDRVAELLRDRGALTSGLLHGGHSSILALGIPPGDDRGWAIGIRHPWQLDRRLALVRLRNRALATSAATFQHLEYNGKKLGHILDPRTGWPAEGIASATVLAPSAAEADALATAFFVLGVEAAQTYCKAHAEVSALLLPDGDDQPVVLGSMIKDITLTADH